MQDDEIVSGDIEDALPEAEAEVEEEGLPLDLDEHGKKKKDLIDDDVVESADDLEEEELEGEDEPFDDVNLI